MTLYQLPLIGHLLKQLDHDMLSLGFQGAMQRIVDSSSTKLETDVLKPQLENILKNKPVVLVANHPFESEVVALIAALPARKDIFLVVNGHFIGVSKNLDKHLIPVYIWHHISDGKPKKFLGKILHRLHPTPVYDPEEEHRKNIESIKVASEKVKAGGLVIIFPGRRAKHGKWFPGVGHLIKGLGKQTRAYIVKSYIKGTSDIDYLRLIPKLGKFLPPLKVLFADATIAQTIYDDDGKKIAENLEKEYNKWLETL